MNEHEQYTDAKGQQLVEETEAHLRAAAEVNNPALQAGANEIGLGNTNRPGGVESFVLRTELPIVRALGNLGVKRMQVEADEVERRLTGKQELGRLSGGLGVTARWRK